MRPPRPTSIRGATARGSGARRARSIGYSGILSTPSLKVIRSPAAGESEGEGSRAGTFAGVYAAVPRGVGRTTCYGGNGAPAVRCAYIVSIPFTK